MKRRFLGYLSLLLLFTIFATSQAQESICDLSDVQAPVINIDSDELIVQIALSPDTKGNVSSLDLYDNNSLLRQSLNAVKITSISSMNVELWRIDFPLLKDGIVISNIREMVTYLKDQNYVAYVQPNYIYQSDATPNDPNFVYQNYLLDSQKGQIGSTQAWDNVTGTSQMKVSILDSGIDIHHEDLANNLWINKLEYEGTPGVDDDKNGYIDDIHGWNFIDDNNNLEDNNGHGTHIAGIIGAVGNNHIGITGINWNIQMMTLKCFDANGQAKTSDIIRAINYSIDKGIKLSNFSWGGSYCDHLLETAIDKAEMSGQLIVCSGGNAQSPSNNLAFNLSEFPIDDNEQNSINNLNQSVNIAETTTDDNYQNSTDNPSQSINITETAIDDNITKASTSDFIEINMNDITKPSLDNLNVLSNINNIDVFPYFPGSFLNDNIIVVMASDANDNGVSKYGKNTVDVAAPGKHIYSTLPNNQYGYKSGASMATAYVTGVAALLWSNQPNLSVEQVKEKIMCRAYYTPSLENKCVAQGRLDAANLLNFPATIEITCELECSGTYPLIFSSGSSLKDALYGWFFEDGTISLEENPIHHATSKNNYGTYLFVVDACGNSETIHQKVQTDKELIVQPSYSINSLSNNAMVCSFEVCGNPPFSYSWDTTIGAVYDYNHNKGIATIEYGANSQWQITITDADGDTWSYGYSKGNKKDNITDLPQPNVFPNPFRENISVDYKITQSGNVSIQLLDLKGNIIEYFNPIEYPTAGQYQQTFPADHLPKGMYIIQIQTPDENFYQKIIKT